MHNRLQESGELEKHVRSVGRSACEMYETIALQMTQRLPDDPQQRQSRIKSIPLMAEEIVLKDIVYQPVRHRA